MEIVKKLHDIGYTKLYLLTGKTFFDTDFSEYLLVISKIDVELFESYVN